mmetsp:Transcript_50411/g.83791  ORF Transcript_50411/g.83791 Transcript_50411/m.83791 type:complete len:230 (-) Transcript_50411:137-826(-)
MGRTPMTERITPSLASSLLQMHWHDKQCECKSAAAVQQSDVDWQRQSTRIFVLILCACNNYPGLPRCFSYLVFSFFAGGSASAASPSASFSACRFARASASFSAFRASCSGMIASICFRYVFKAAAAAALSASFTVPSGCPLNVFGPSSRQLMVTVTCIEIPFFSAEYSISPFVSERPMMRVMPVFNLALESIARNVCKSELFFSLFSPGLAAASTIAAAFFTAMGTCL